MVQSWIRQALRASGVAILVPVAVVAALALSVIGGGGGASSLGQVLTGPAVPPAEASQPPPGQTRRETEGTVPSVRRGPRRAARAPGRAPRRAPVRTLPPLPRRPSGSPLVPSRPVPSPPPAPAPRPVHDTGTQVADTLRPLPVAGPVAADAVQAVADLVDPLT